jgi:O-antigen/teichoic acid export membrane protein
MFKQASLISLSKLLEKSFSFLAIIQLTYIFQPYVIGKFFFYFSLISVLMPIMDFGLKKLFVVKSTALKESTKAKLFGTLISLKFFCGFLALAIALILELSLNWSSPSLLAIFYCFVAVFADDLGQLFRSADHAKEIYKYEILSPIVNKLTCLLAIYFSTPFLTSVESALRLYALSSLLGASLSLLALKSCIPDFNTHYLKYHSTKLLKEGFPFSITTLFVMVSFYIDSVILGLHSLEENGIYNAAFRIIIVFGFLSSGVSHVLFAKFSRKSKNDAMQINQSLHYVVPIVLTVFTSLAIGTAALSNSAVALIYKEQYAEAANLLFLLSPFIIFSSLSNIFAHTLEACGLQKKVMKFNASTCLFNLITNLIFIPFGGMYAAAITTIFTEAANTFLSYRELKKQGLTIKAKSLLPNIYILFVMSITGFFAYQLSLFTGALLGAAVFVPLLILHFKYLKTQNQEFAACVS